MISTIFSIHQLDKIATSLEHISGDTRYPKENYTERIASSLRTLSKKNGGSPDDYLDKLDFAEQIAEALQKTDDRWEDIAGGGSSEYPDYDGPYDITPGVTGKELSTKDTILHRNVRVYDIPYTEVTNPKGGKTATIAFAE